MTATPSYYIMLEGREYYFLVIIVLLAANTIFVCPKERRFKFGIYLNLTAIALVLGFYCSYYSTYYPYKYYSPFDIPGFDTPDIYSFPSIDLTFKLSLLSIILGLASIWFLIKTWIALLHRKMSFREIFTVILLGIFTATAFRPLLNIKANREGVMLWLQNRQNSFYSKLIATEEKTEKDALNHPDYWGAQYMRAQYLYFTNRKKESVEYYKKTLKLLGDDEGNVDEFIKERLEELK